MIDAQQKVSRRRRKKYIFHHGEPKCMISAIQARKAVAGLRGMHRDSRQESPNTSVEYKALDPEHLCETMRVISVMNSAMLVRARDRVNVAKFGAAISQYQSDAAVNGVHGARQGRHDGWPYDRNCPTQTHHGLMIEETAIFEQRRYSPQLLRPTGNVLCLHSMVSAKVIEKTILPLEDTKGAKSARKRLVLFQVVITLRDARKSSLNLQAEQV
jgi:hypothetical protein